MDFIGTAMNADKKGFKPASAIAHLFEASLNFWFFNPLESDSANHLALAQVGFSLKDGAIS
jgi:hypothetical protein